MLDLPDGLTAPTRNDDWDDWAKEWVQRCAAAERAEFEKKYPRLLVERFDLSDVRPSVLDGTAFEWSRSEVMVRCPRGITHRLPTANSPITACGLLWSYSESATSWRRVLAKVDCLGCLAAL